jgi:predicted nuclease of predicted toxin-antitoxin system
VRFLLDQNVDARVRRVFTSRSHECWTVADANLATASDDDITIYAMSKDAVVVTHDVEFSQRRLRNPIGRHLQLRCDEFDAADLLVAHFDAVLCDLSSAENVFVRVGADGCQRMMRWQ